MVVVVELDVLVAAGALTIALPFAETAYHLAPNARFPSPFVCPACLSSAKV